MDDPAATATGTPSPTWAPSESPTPAETVTETPTPTPRPAPPADQVVEVGPNQEFSFEPETFTISTGDRVRWTWESGGHNVRPASQPDDASWSGTPGGDDTTYDSEYTYAYEFAVAGEYEYYCAPHRSLGMTGSFTVK